MTRDRKINLAGLRRHAHHAYVGSDALLAMIDSIEAAWRIVAANYETAGLDETARAPLWEAIADAEKLLREFKFEDEAERGR